jgi:hypothetical protein
MVKQSALHHSLSRTLEIHMFRGLIFFLAYFAYAVASGQDASSLNGTWVATFPSPTGLPRDARVVISNGAGTYQLLAKNRDDPCVGLEAPVLISNMSNEGFDMAILTSKAMVGCRDTKWETKRIDDKTYEGVFGDGRKFVLRRQ